MGYGSVQISAASDVRLEVRVQVGLGSIDMPNGSEDGYRRVATYADGPSDAPLVRYDIAVGFGSIEVDRFRPGAPPLTAEPWPRPTLGPIQSDGDGGLVFEDGAHQLADGTIYLPDGTVVFPDGSWVLGSEAKVLPTGEVILDDGTSIAPDGTVILWSGIVIRPVPPGSIGLAPTTVPAVPPGPEASSVPTSAPAATDPAAIPTSTVAVQP